MYTKRVSVESVDFGEQFAERRSLQVNPAAIKKLRPQDFEIVKEIVHKSIEGLFGFVNVEEKVEKCYISLGILNDAKEILAFACFQDHPNIPAIPPWAWSKWIANLYHLPMVNSKNSLWLHYAAWDETMEYLFLKVLFQHIFADFALLEYVLLVVPPGFERLDFAEPYGTRVKAYGYPNPVKVQSLYLFSRQHFVTKYKIRRAVEEDNDDLVPLIDTHNPLVKDFYGEFYIAELLTRYKDCGRQLIVAEHKELAVAVMCLNEAVNYDLLNENFELSTFHGLRKVDEDDAAGGSSVSSSTEQDDQSLDSQSIQVGWNAGSAASSISEDLSYGSTSEVALNDEKSGNEVFNRRKSGDSGVRDSIAHVEGESVEHEGEEELDKAKMRFSIFDKDTESQTSEIFKIGSEEDAGSGQKDIDDDELVRIASSDLFLLDLIDSIESVIDEKSIGGSELMLATDYKSHLFTDRKPEKDVDDIEYMKILANQMVSKRRPPEYAGEPNAFTLEIAASMPEHEGALIHLLEASFECFTDREYCIMSIPHNFPPFSLLNQFVRVVPNNTSNFPHELYVLHRSAMRTTLMVRNAVPEDLPYMEGIIKQLLKPESLSKLVLSSLAHVDSLYRTFVFLCGTTMIGICVVREEYEVEQFNAHYRISDWVNVYSYKPGTHGLIEFFVLSPIFKKHSEFLLREVHRLSDFGILYYSVFPSDKIALDRTRPLATILDTLLPAVPAMIPELDHVEEFGKSKLYNEDFEPNSIYLSTPRHCSLPKYRINSRILVIGGSEIAVSFLESLIFSMHQRYHLILNNITLIAPHGLPFSKPYDEIRDAMFVTHSVNSPRHMQLISLRTYINIVNGVMTEIDRKNKRIIVNYSNSISYDLLFLMCGEQFQKPKVEHKKKKTSRFPQNVFIVNSDIDASSSLAKLSLFINDAPVDTQWHVIVYGYELEAFCCLEALLKAGIPGQNLIYVEPVPTGLEKPDMHANILLFNDHDVEEAVHACTREQGITIHSYYYLKGWDCADNKLYVSSVTFESKYKVLELECLAMFVYTEKLVSQRTFMAINNAGLVFDGRLVVTPECQTNDPNIYAAGTCTKYSRKYYAEHMQHKYYNHSEIGRKLGLRIRKMFVPEEEEFDDSFMHVECNRGDMLVPRYEEPLTIFCTLPGGLNYLYICKPGKQVPVEISMGEEDFGHVLVTGDPHNLDHQGYFKLHINQQHTVETITCLSKNRIDRNNLTYVWGKHERLLNNIELRFEMGLITDLFSYFKESWISALYHSQYQKFDKSTREVLMSLSRVPGESLIEDIVRTFEENKWKDLTPMQQQNICAKFENSRYHDSIREKFLTFLEENMVSLPMYATPVLISLMHQGLENSPLFAKQ